MLQSVEHRKQNEVWGYRKQILLRETKKKTVIHIWETAMEESSVQGEWRGSSRIKYR